MTDHKHDENEDICEECGGKITPEIELLERNLGTMDQFVETYEKGHIVLTTVAEQYGHTVWREDESEDFYPGDHPSERFTLSLTEEQTKSLIDKLQVGLTESQTGVKISDAPPVGERN